MAFPKGLFTPNIVRVQNPKPATRPFSQEAVRVSGMQGPRGYFRAPREPEIPKPQTLKPTG
jgi:hypothetical protein